MTRKPTETADAMIQRLYSCGALAAVAAIFLVQVASFWNYTNDDAYITLRYSRFLALGRGPYFNIGEHVEGYTNFSLMVLLSLIVRLFGPEVGPPAAKILCAGFGLFAVAATFLLLRRLLLLSGQRSAAAVVWATAGAGILAVNPGFAVNSASGLETSLFALCLVVGAHLALLEVERCRWLGSGMAFALGALTRPEGLLVFALFWCTQMLVAVHRALATAGGAREAWAFRLRKSVALRILLVNGLLVTVVLTLHLTFRLAAYDGEWLPNTFYAKSGGFWQPAYSYVAAGLFPALFWLPGIAAALAGLALGAAHWRVLLSVTTAAVLGGMLPWVTGTDWMMGWRLVAQYLPLAVVAATAGWTLLAARIPRVPPAVVACLALLLPAAQWFLHDATRQNIRAEIELRARGYGTGHRALADWLCRGVAQSGKTIALMDTGIIGYTCIDQNILDITGLTNRHIAKSPGGFLKKEYAPGYVLGQHPEFIVLTLKTPGVSYQPPPPGAKFSFWTSTEEQLFESPEFQNRYVLPATGDSGGTWLEMAARSVGAIRVFEHAEPRYLYYLVVFRDRMARKNTV